MRGFFPRMVYANLSMRARMGKSDRIMLSLLSPFACDSFVKGEGAVVVVLKPVDKAIANNDHIYSVASLRPPYVTITCIDHIL